MTSAPYIRTGAMRSPMTLQAKVTTADGAGGVDVTWEDARTVWGHLRPLSGTQRLEGMQRESQVSHEFYTRYAADVAPGVVELKRLLDSDGAPFNILAAWCPNDVKEFVHMQLTRGVAT